MYQSHFGFKQLPFTLTPDTQFFCALPPYVEAMNVLLLALHHNEGFIKITGNVGCGKSLLCRKLLNELSSPYITAYIPNPQLTPVGLRMAVADEFGIQYSRYTGEHQLLSLINKFLVAAVNNYKKPVLIIDEAQAMSIETLDALRLLTNLETEKQKLLQIVLFGQPELDQHLQAKNIRQLRQRITFSYRLHGLNYQQTLTYIEHRLQTARNQQAVAFTSSRYANRQLRPANKKHGVLFSALAQCAIYYYSQGVPRLINILANKAMLVAFGKGQHQISLGHVYHAAQDTEDTYKRSKFILGNRLCGYLAFALFTTLTTFLWFNHAFHL